MVVLFLDMTKQKGSEVVFLMLVLHDKKNEHEDEDEH